MSKLVELVKLNGLEYNTNRDPQVYRRVPGKPFRFEVTLRGSGSAQARFQVEGRTAHESTVSLPGRVDFILSFDSPGIRVGELVVEGAGERFQRLIRLDVDERPWAG